MSNSESIKRVRIYLSERDQTSGQPLYLATLDRLQREGATGATVVRGIAGFGASQRLHTSGAGGYNATPLVIEWVDRIERIGRILPLLDDLLGEALVTVEDLRVYRAVMRSNGPFGERTAGQMMQREPASARPDTPLRDAVALMLEREQNLLPVIDMRGALVGTLSATDLAQRGGLLLPFRLLPALNATERQALLAQLPEHTIAEVMSSDVRTIYVDSSIPQALSPMIEWGIEALPVLDREGALVGLFGVEQALRAAVREPSPNNGTVRDAEPPTPVGLVMQRAVAAVPSTTQLGPLVELLLNLPERFVLVQEENKPVGLITDLSLTRRLGEPARSAWLGAVRNPGVPFTLAPESEFPLASSLTERDLPTLSEQSPQDEALRVMLAGNHEQLIVLGEGGRLAGVLTRRALLRSLAQAVA